MDQPTYTPTQKIVEATGTLFFKFGDLDSTKPAGSIRIRIETIVHYLAKYSDKIIQKKLALLPPDCPLLQNQQEKDEKALASVAGSD
jgi:predicted nucleotide-binding protein (sugar kinase/HSP70/actin superfamily)